MFQQVASQLIADKAGGVIRPSPVPLAGQASFDSICVRLDRDLPAGPYLTDKVFADLLGVTLKTLSNKRCLNPEYYPRSFRLGGSRVGMHVRSEIIEWLAHEEFSARTTVVHRCH